MRLALVVAFALAACTRPEESSTREVRSDDLTLASVRLPPDTRTREISDTVAMSGDGAVTLDSGGPNTIPLWMDASTKVTLDDHPATSGQLREGDLVRAAYRFDPNSGDPLALVVVANSRPVRSPAVTRPAPAPAPPPSR